jgi:hypothetical protein
MLRQPSLALHDPFQNLALGHALPCHSIAISPLLKRFLHRYLPRAAVGTYAYCTRYPGLLLESDLGLKAVIDKALDPVGAGILYTGVNNPGIGGGQPPVICVETRHMRAVLQAQINKTDRNDARGMAQMMRAGLYRPVHVKTLRSQKLRMLLTHRKLLQSKAIAIDNDLRGTLRNFGLKVGVVGTVKFEARIKELVENLPDLAVLVEPLLLVRRVLREQFSILHRRLLAIVNTPSSGPADRPKTPPPPSGASALLIPVSSPDCAP